MTELDIEAVANLTKSINTIGQIYPTLYDSDGELLSGKHRKAAGGDKQDTVNTELIAARFNIPRAVAKLLVKMHANVQRQVRRAESQALVLAMAGAFEDAGVPPAAIAATVTQWAPYTQQYVLELLPAKYKQPMKQQAGAKGGEARAAKLVEQTSPPPVVNNNAAELVRQTGSKSKEGAGEPSPPPSPPSPLREPTSYPSPRASDFARKAYTPAEMRILEELTKRRHAFLSQVPFPREAVNAEGKPLAYIADIVVNQQVVVEIDGPGHDFAGDPERDAFFVKLGYVVHHMTNDHALGRPVFAVDELEHILARASKNGLMPAPMKQHALQRIGEQIHLGLLRHDFTPAEFWATLWPIDAEALRQNP